MSENGKYPASGFFSEECGTSYGLSKKAGGNQMSTADKDMPREVWVGEGLDCYPVRKGDSEEASEAELTKYIRADLATRTLPTSTQREEASVWVESLLDKAKKARATVGNCPSTKPFRGKPVEMYEEADAEVKILETIRAALQYPAPVVDVETLSHKLVEWCDEYILPKCLIQQHIQAALEKHFSSQGILKTEGG